MKHATGIVIVGVLVLGIVGLFNVKTDKRKSLRRSYSTAVIKVNAPLKSSEAIELAEAKQHGDGQTGSTVSGLTTLTGAESLPQTEQQSLWKAFSDARHEIRPLTERQKEIKENQDAHFFAQNPGNQLVTRFMDDGIKLGSGYAGRSWEGKLSLDRGPPIEIRQQGTRVEYDYGDIVEWYHNRPEGVQQGWIVDQPLEADNEFLVLGLEVLGLKVEPLADREDGVSDLQFINESGEPVVSYSGLKAWDANGVELETSMEPTGDGFQIFVADVGAAYPVTIDPLIASLEQELGPEVTGTGVPGDEFGESVSVSGNTALVGSNFDDAAYVFVRSGTAWNLEARLMPDSSTATTGLGSSVSLDQDTAVVGSPFENTTGGNTAGAVFIFTRSGTTWSQQAKLEANDAAASDNFGRSVSVEGDTVLVGMEYDDTAVGSNAGSAYVFVRSGTAWSQQAKLEASDAEANDYFGHSVSVDGDTALLGADSDDTLAGTNAGSAYVFIRSGTTWSQQAKLEANDAVAYDTFGASVSLSGDTALVGASHVESPTDVNNTGAAYVFVRSGTAWSQQAKLEAADSGSGDIFGSAVSLEGDTAVIGAHQADAPRGSNQGAAYVFVRSGTVWSQEARLEVTLPEGSLSDHFGFSVSVDADTALIGAPEYDTDGGNHGGAAYVFKRSGNIWSLQGNLDSGTAAKDDQFGYSVSLDVNTALVGVHRDDTPAGENAGSAYVFVRDGVIWSLEAILEAEDADVSDQLGISVSIHGDTALVGATDDSLVSFGAGSAYVFVRSGTTWSQQAKLVAGDGESRDEFGNSVSVYGDTALVGAEDDHTTAGSDAGSAYVFVRSGTVWSEQTKLEASDAEASDIFGRSVSLGQDRALIGSHGNDDAGSASGSAYVFVRSGTVWTQEQKLVAGDSAAGDTFGYSVSLDEDTALIGASAADDATIGNNTGATYVFVRSGSSWSQQAKLVAADAVADDQFGRSVALDENTAVIGTGIHINNPGAAYIFERNGTSWSQQHRVNGDALELFGRVVGISGDTVAIGAYGKDGLDSVGESMRDQGGVYIFRLNEYSGPTDLALTNSTVDENTPSGSPVGSLTANDPDDPESFTYSLVSGTGDEDNSFFSIGGTNNDELLTAAVFDYESKSSYFVRLQVTDSDNNSYEEAFTINVIDDRTEDADGDGVTEAVEEDTYGTSDTNPNTDGDAFDDGLEVAAGTDPNDANEEPKFGLNDKLPASDSQSGDDLGFSVAIDGDTAVIGAPGLNFGGGVAYVFVRSGNRWIEQDKLAPTISDSNDRFGYSVDVTGNTAIVGAYGDDDQGGSAGTAYVFIRNGENWSLEQKLFAGDAEANDQFGGAVGIDGDLAVIGARYEDERGDNSGAAYIFERDAGVWTETKKLMSAVVDSADHDAFGHSVAISNDAVVVGKYSDDEAATNAGAAYIFRNSGQDWVEEDKIMADDAIMNHAFSESVDINDDTVVIGATRDAQLGTNTGAAYVFVHSGGTWSQEAKLVSPSPQDFDNFGWSVGIDGDLVVVGANVNHTAGNDSGAAYAYLRNGSTWEHESIFLPENADDYDHFGNSVDISGGRAVIGSPATNTSNTGSFYIFELTKDTDAGSTTWQENNGFDPDVPNDEQTLDSDGDGVQDIWEIFQGTDRNSAGESYGLQQTTSTAPNTLTTQFRRSTDQNAVSAEGKWSTDLVNWYGSGQENGDGVTVNFTEQEVDSGTGYQIVEVSVVATGTAPEIFYKLELSPNEGP